MYKCNLPWEYIILTFGMLGNQVTLVFTNVPPDYTSFFLTYITYFSNLQLAQLGHLANVILDNMARRYYPMIIPQSY